MLIQISFAILAGILTVAAPCILPMLPILLGSSVGQQSKQRPLLIVLGFIVSFSAASLLLSFIVQHLGLNPNLLRNAAVVCLAIFAAFMIWPKPFELLTLKMSGTINSAGQIEAGQGNMSGLILGLVLGIIWTPCAGPILASILVLIATQGSSARSEILLLAYAVGAGIPMLIIAYGSQYITNKVRWIAQYSVRLQQIFGVLILLLAVAMYFQYDIIITNKLTAYFPQSNLENKLASPQNNLSNQAATNGLSPAPPQGRDGNGSPMIKIDFQNYGKAPEFTGINNWVNTAPLTIAELKGKVVLIDFWTYSCINCLRTLPFTTKWYDTYKDKGLVIIGVHTPEFAFEKDTNNVQSAINRLGIHYPVAQDNDYGTWTAYNNQYWPAEYLIDQNGNIVYEHFGEGEYDHTENAIRQLLSYNTAVAPENGQDLTGVQSPEMYFETTRLQNLSPDQQPSAAPQTYTFTQSLALNNFALDGTWEFTNDHATLTNGSGKIRLHYHSSNVFMVASSNNPITLTVKLDGNKTGEVTVQAPQLYQLVKSDVAGDHILEIDIPNAGFQAFTFTFG
jgi:cytochrome c biogenesis protein CcdA/thiol-disulfide isomerase/thioredoxin